MSDDAAADAWSAFRPWALDATLGVLVLVAGVVEQANVHWLADSTRWSLVVVAACIGVAAGLFRKAPGVALLLVWFTGGLQVSFDLPLLLTEAAVAFVAFGAARYGSRATVVLSGLSIPAAGIIAVYFLRQRGFGGVLDPFRYRTFYDAAQQLSSNWLVGAGIIAAACLTVPWMAGLALRFSDRASVSQAEAVAAHEDAVRAQRESEQAREIARLREEQNQLARDVHDVVGHSLAVILAQAESAQFLDDADTGALRLSMSNIANSARSSLKDVRQVLTPGTDPAVGPGELHDLIEGVRASGHTIELDEIGSTRPLAPEIATVAYRVLQEMLTNAIRHGRRHGTVRVELHWAGELRIEVVNEIGDDEPTAESGNGLEGMGRRLESVGGRLDVRRRGTDQPTFTATAWIPVRTVYP